MASLYIIAIGGTGAKCAEAIIHAVAAGLFTPNPLQDSKIKILFVDPDEANGNIERAQKTYKIYQDCYALFQDSLADGQDWMSMPIENKGVWSPFKAGNKTLTDLFKYSTYQETPIGDFFNVLYTQAEQKDNLDEGFHGHPAVGAAVMSQINLSQGTDEFWQTFINEVKLDFNRGIPKIFICGSIFGGTGAAGIPTIGQLIHNELERINGLESARLGALLMLPYFTYQVPPNQDPEEIYADPKEFVLKSEAALQYYLGQAEKIFNIIYILGDNEQVEIGKFQKGKAGQINKPHFLELYTALAARHFWLSNEVGTEWGKVALMESTEAGDISWQDIPRTEPNQLGNEVDARDALIAMTRFAFGWTAGCAPELQKANKIGVKQVQDGIPWFSQFFRPETLFGWGQDKNLPELKDEIETINTIDVWCENFLSWLGLIHYKRASGERNQIFQVDKRIKLFQPDKFADPDGQSRKKLANFPDLVVDYPPASFRELTAGLTKSLKKKLGSTNVGTVGLAKALYLLSKPN